MNNSITLGKRVVSAFVAGATILWAVGMAAFAVPTVAVAASGGDLITGTSLSTVYYYGYDGSRYTFPNEKTYLTWFDDFSGVTTLSDSALADISLAGNVVYRPGSHWIKIQSDPKTYAVATDGSIQWVETEAVATDYAGSDWNTIIHDVPDTFFVDYTTGASLMTATAFDGMMYMDGSDYYLAWGGEKRAVSAAGRSANDMMTEFFLDGDGIDDSSLSAGAEITGALCDLQDAAQTGGCSTAVTGGDVTVSLASSTPAGATVPMSATSVEVFSFNLTAGSEAAEVNQIVLTMDSLGSTSDLTAVYLYEGSSRLTESRTVNSSTRQATFGALNLDLAAGETKTITVRVEVAASGTATVGNLVSFEISDADDVILVGGDSTGSFPVSGNEFSIGGVSVGSVTVTKNGTITNPALGADDATIGQFKIAATTEDAEITELTLKIDNTASHSDFKLWDGDTLLDEGVDIGSKLVLFDLSSSPFAITNGGSNIFKVTADIGGENGDDVKVAFDKSVDVVAIGASYGFGMGVDISSTGTYGETGSSCTSSSNDCSFSDVAGGDITMSLVGPSAGQIRTNSQDQVLLEFTLTASQDATIKDLDVIVYADDDGDNDPFDAVDDATDTDDDGLIVGSGTNEAGITDIKIVNKATGAVVMGPLELDGYADSNDDADQTIDFTDDFSMDAGETLTLQVTADIDNSVTSGTEFGASIDVSGFSAEDSNSDSITNVVPGADLQGYAQEAVAASLVVALASTPGDVTTVQGADDVLVNKFSFTGGDAGEVNISQIVLSVYGDDDGDESFTIGGETDADVNDYIESCSIYDVDGDLIDGPDSPATNGQTITFNDVAWTIDAGESEVMSIYCNIANVSDTDNDYFSFDIATLADDIVAEDEDGTDVDPTTDAPNGGTSPTNILTVVEAGSLASAKDSSSPDADFLITGTSDNLVAVYRLTATNEPFEVQTFTVSEYAAEAITGTANSSAYANNIELVTIEFENEDGDTVTSTSTMTGKEAKFTGLDMYVGINDPAKVKVYVDVPATDRNAGGNATSNERVRGALFLDTTDDDNFKAVGSDSGKTLDDDDVTEITTSATFVVKETRPTLSLSSSSPSGSGFIPGDQEVLRFNIAAHGNEDVILDQMVFSISATDNASTPTGWNECDTLTTSDFDLYNMSTTGTSTALDIDGDWTFFDSTGAVSTSAVDMAFFSLGMGGDLTTPITIPAGETQTFALYLDSTGASAASDDSLQVGIASDPIVSAASFLAGSDLDDALSLTATTVPVTATTSYSVGDIVCLDNEDDACDSDDELALVTAITSGESLTVIRGYLGTAPVAAGVSADDVDRIPSTLFWQDDGDDSTSNSGQMWGSYLVDSLPITGGTMGF